MRRIASTLVEHGRATEWLTSSVLLIFAAILSIPGDTFTARAYEAFTKIGLDEAAVAVPLALLAAARLAALYINGNWRRSPMLRMAGASLGASIFTMLGLAILWPALQSGAPVSTGVGTYLVLALFDVLSAYRSGADARLAYPIRRP